MNAEKAALVVTLLGTGAGALESPVGMEFGVGPEGTGLVTSAGPELTAVDIVDSAGAGLTYTLAAGMKTAGAVEPDGTIMSTAGMETAGALGPGGTIMFAGMLAGRVARGMMVMVTKEVVEPIDGAIKPTAATEVEPSADESAIDW